MSNDPTFLWLDSTSWTAITAIATAALVIVGGLTIISAAIDSRAKSRPYVVAELKVRKYGSGLALVVTNYGASAAKNVRVKLPKSFDEVDEDDPYRGNSTAAYMRLLRRKYNNAIPIIGPGQSESNIWIQRAELIEAKEPSPKATEAITISYDKFGWFGKLFGRRYSDVFPMDFDHRIHDTYSQHSRDTEQRLKVMNQHLRDIHTSLRVMTEIMDPEEEETVKRGGLRMWVHRVNTLIANAKKPSDSTNSKAQQQ